MREIKFRGKNSKGVWIYGDLLHNRGETFIAPIGIANPLSTANDYKVIARTIGEYTGLTDSSGKDIFEGDILEYEGYTGVIRGVVKYEYNRFVLSQSNRKCVEISFHTFTKIGNIYDNPELMKGNETMKVNRPINDCSCWNCKQYQKCNDDGVFLDNPDIDFCINYEDESWSDEDDDSYYCENIDHNNGY